MPGVLGTESSLQDESFQDGLLDYPQYTAGSFRNLQVPEVLLSGHHEQIRRFRLKNHCAHSAAASRSAADEALSAEKAKS